MILTIYITLIAIGFILLGLSYYLAQFDNIDTTITLRVIGSIFIFITGLTMAQGNIEYDHGKNITILSNVTTIETPITASYQNHSLGYTFSIAGAIIFALTFLDVKQIRRKEED